MPKTIFNREKPHLTGNWTMKKLLILGGSQQIGRRLIEHLLATADQRYQIHTFNRGQTNPDLLKRDGVKKIIGDRNTDDIEKILNRDWDVILDCSCYDPIPLKKLLSKIKGRVGRYVFISTISVYDYQKNIKLNGLIPEGFKLLDFTEAQIREEGYKCYGEKKVAAEKYLLDTDIDSIIFRPHFIYGRYDWQNLDYYWINRIQQYQEILVPGGKDLIHRTYIEDLVACLMESFDLTQHQGIYNIATHQPLSINDYVEQLAQILDKKVTFTSVNSEKLLAHGVRPILDLPLWSNGSHFIFSTKRLATDFTSHFPGHYQSLEDTVKWNQEIEHWTHGKSKWEAGRLGLSREKETEMLRSTSK